MSWNTCTYPECENWTARPDGDYCESCRRLILKQEQDEKKATEKRKALLLKPMKLRADITQPIYKMAKIKKVSDKLDKKLKIYRKLADEFKRENPTCIARVNQYCTGKTESVHHKRGRGKYLLDVSTFLPCCLSCHSYIEAHPKEAKEKGWSESRLSLKEPTV